MICAQHGVLKLVSRLDGSYEENEQRIASMLQALIEVTVNQRMLGVACSSDIDEARCQESKNLAKAHPSGIAELLGDE